MVNEATINKLHDMKLSAMAQAFRQQMQEPTMNAFLFLNALVFWLITNGIPEKTTGSNALSARLVSPSQAPAWKILNIEAIAS